MSKTVSGIGIREPVLLVRNVIEDFLSINVMMIKKYLKVIGNAPIDVTYEWYNLDVGPDVTEVWDDGSFTSEDVGKTVFNSLEEYEKAFPEDFDFGDIDE